MLTKGDKIKLVRPMGVFTNVGEICTVIEVEDNGTVWFKFGNGMHMGCMSANEFEKYFEKYEEPKPEPVSVDVDWVDELINESDIDIYTVFNKCTVVACKLPSGFVIVESSACIDPKNYDKDMGIEICLNRIKDRICEMEAYRIADEMWDEGHTDCLDEDEDDECEGCDCPLCH